MLSPSESGLPFVYVDSPPHGPSAGLESYLLCVQVPDPIGLVLGLLHSTQDLLVQLTTLRIFKSLARVEENVHEVSV